MDCRTPSEAAILPPPPPTSWSDIDDYRKEVTLSLFTTRANAVKSIRKAQQRYKRQYDRNAGTVEYSVGQWVLVRFPADETGRNRKPSRPWHGPYRVVAIKDPDITVANIYFPRDKQITVHQSRMKHCPTNFPAAFYWYGGKQKGQGKIPKWVENLLADHQDGKTDQATDMGICEEEADGNSEVGEQLEAETDTCLEKTETPQPKQGAHEKLSRTVSTGYSLRKNPLPSRKLIVSQARD